MSDRNTVVLEGNLTQDLDMQTSKAGNVFARSSIAVNRSKRDASGNWDDEAHFFDFTVFGDLAEHAASSLSKGSRVVLSGRLQQDRWTTEVDGETQNRTKVTIVVDDISPSLRWATASVTKVGKSNGSSNSAAVEEGIQQLEEAFGPL